MPLNTPIKDWSNKRVWIIGASTGIGEALAKQLSHAGARLFISARSKDKLELLAGALNATRALPFDMTHEAAVAHAAETVFAEWGGVDVVVVMAGTYVEMRAQNFDLAAAKHQVEVNINGVLNVLAPVLPQLIKQGSGHISLVSSVAGYSGLPNGMIYGASKAALINMAEALLVDLSENNVDVSLVCPGFVETPLTAKNEFPMPFIITVEEAAKAMVDSFARGDFEMHFPKKFTRILKFLRLLPYTLYFAAVKKTTGMGGKNARA
ncbi:MAG: SDR family NAD(P)-dependent oxidoreductase [Burkholderiales bacterium]|nr:SDR family NAD(P)-dependent oxidoreductase [Burkholderiales bacterium]